MQYHYFVALQLFLQSTLFCQSVFLSGSLACRDCKPLKKGVSFVTPAVLIHSFSLDGEALVNFHLHDSIDYIRQVLIKRWLRSQVQPPSTMYIIIWVAAYALRSHNNQRWNWSYFCFYWVCFHRCCGDVYSVLDQLKLLLLWDFPFGEVITGAICLQLVYTLLIIFQWISWSGPKTALASFHRPFPFLTVK